MADSWTVRAAAAGASTNIVYSGENVPKGHVEQGYSLVDGGEASSLTVFSGYRLRGVARVIAYRAPR